MPDILRYAQRDGTGDRHAALAREQALAREVNRDEPGRAGGLHRTRGSGQTEFIGGARRQEILIVGQHQGVRAGRLDQALIGQEIGN